MGGGGGDSLGAVDFYLGAVGDQIRAERDFILYNQRGVKRNDPYLVCPGEKDFQKQLTGVIHTKTESDRLEYDFLLNCRDDLRESDIDLDFYDSVTHAADLVDLIRLLGYEQANIYGTSYGTRLGLTLIRHHPNVIRSAILDAVLPPQVNFPSDAITSYLTAMENLFQACASQEDCQEKYPDLEDDFYSILEDLLAEPAVIEIDGDEVVLDHILFLDTVYLLLHHSSDLPNIPLAIHNAALGEYSWLVNPIRNIQGYSDFVTTGVQYSSMCKDEVNFDRLEISQALLVDLHPAWKEYFELSFYYDICREWIIEPASEVENTPVISDIPTLLLAGHLDSITASAWSEDAASYLENSFYYEFPNLAHGTVRYDNCALSIALEFIDDPQSEPDVSCMEELGYPLFE
jgi:pimeloyl-ACP methyl ester carboxylesterase